MTRKGLPSVLGYRSRLSLGALLALLAGCPTPPDGTATEQRPQPLEVAGKVALYQPEAKRLFALQDKNGSAELRSLSARLDGLPMREAADRSRLVWLDARNRQAVATNGSTLQKLPLGAAFTGLRLTADGQFAVTLHQEGEAAVDGLVNTDDIALVDLVKATVQTATVADLAASPFDAVVSGPLQAADGEHRLVVLLAQSKLGLADFGPAGVRTQVVPLTADPKSPVRPQQVEVRAVAGGASLYVTAQGLADVLHLQLDLNQTTLQVALDQIAAGQQPIAMQVAEVAEGTRILTVGSSRQQLSWLDPQTGTGMQLALQAGVGQLQLAAGPSGLPLAVGSLAGSNSVVVMDLPNLTKKKGKALTVLALDAPVREVQVLAGKLIVQHTGATPALTVVDLATFKRSTFASKAVPLAMRLAGDFVWLLIPDGQETLLARVALADLRGEVLTLGEPATALLRLGAAGMAVAGQGGSGGWWVAAFPSGNLTGKDRWVVDGYAWQGLLDAEVK